MVLLVVGNRYAIERIDGIESFGTALHRDMKFVVAFPVQANTFRLIKDRHSIGLFWLAIGNNNGDVIGVTGSCAAAPDKAQGFECAIRGTNARDR